MTRAKRDRCVGPRPVSVTINRYGMDPRDRLGNTPRTHRVDVITRRSSEELFAGHRGACMAVLQAHHEGNLEDLKLALIRQQTIATALLKRALQCKKIHIVYQDDDHFAKDAPCPPSDT